VKVRLKLETILDKNAPKISTLTAYRLLFPELFSFCGMLAGILLKKEENL